QTLADVLAQALVRAGVALGQDAAAAFPVAGAGQAGPFAAFAVIAAVIAGQRTVMELLPLPARVLAMEPAIAALARVGAAAGDRFVPLRAARAGIRSALLVLRAAAVRPAAHPGIGAFAVRAAVVRFFGAPAAAA